jgi:predicted kinase
MAGRPWIGTSTLVVLFGLPGSGKSTLAAELCACAPELLGGMSVLVLSADAEFAAVCRERGFSPSLDGSQSSAQAAAWHAARDRLVGRLHELVTGAATTPVLVVVDDTSEHRSWRRRLAREARTGGWRLALVGLDVPVELAISRNSGRPDPEKVPTDSVYSVQAMLEGTASAQGGSKWEKERRSVLDGTLPARELAVELAAIVRSAKTAPLVSEDESVASPLEAVADSLEHPPQQTEDLMLRKHVSQVLRAFRAGSTPSDSLERLAVEQLRRLGAAPELAARLCARAKRKALSREASTDVSASVEVGTKSITSDDVSVSVEVGTKSITSDDVSVSVEVGTESSSTSDAASVGVGNKSSITSDALAASSGVLERFTMALESIDS